MTLPSTTSVLPVCVITGGSSGIGESTAARFAREGYQLAICGRDADRLAAAADRLGPSANVYTHACDIGEVGGARKFIQSVGERFGRVDVVINNAGCAPLGQTVDMALDDVHRLIDVNMLAILATAQSVWPLMKQQQRGVIVHVSSLAAVDPFPGLGLYGACKAWGESLTVSLAREGKPHGIRAFSVRPGAVETPLLRRLFPDFPRDQCLAPAVVAGLIYSLCGPDLAACSGQVFEVAK